MKSDVKILIDSHLPINGSSDVNLPIFLSSLWLVVNIKLHIDLEIIPCFELGWDAWLPPWSKRLILLIVSHCLEVLDLLYCLGPYTKLVMLVWRVLEEISEISSVLFSLIPNSCLSWRELLSCLFESTSNEILLLEPDWVHRCKSPCSWSEHWFTTFKFIPTPHTNVISQILKCTLQTNLVVELLELRNNFKFQNCFYFLPFLLELIRFEHVSKLNLLHINLNLFLHYICLLYNMEPSKDILSSNFHFLGKVLHKNNNELASQVYSWIQKILI